MKVAILAGGLGSRLAEETETRPKPMVEIGGVPILWHIMRHYAHFGFKDFAVALGYKGDYIRRYATDFAALSPGNLRIDYSRRHVEYDTRVNADAWPMDGWSLELVEHRPQHQHRRPHQAAQGRHRQRALLPDLGRRRLGRGPPRTCWSSTSRTAS